MEIEKTFVFTKPGNFEEHLEIFTCADRLLIKDSSTEDFSRTDLVYVNPVPEELIREHYKHISNVPIYEPTIQAFLEYEKGIVLGLYKGKGIIKRMRDVNGHTDPRKAKPNTIRALFSNDSLEKAAEEVRYLNNVMHCSDPENSEREISLWGPYLIGAIFKKFVP